MSGALPPAREPGGEHDVPLGFERFASSVVDLGGTPVRRALPRRGRRTIGAWCFIDHFGSASGPRTVGPGGPMGIGPHPHIGLQTVTWLLEGEVRHLDSLGSDQRIRPGQLNLMTAGRGVSHAEETPAAVAHRPQHGAQLWVAQPDATRRGEPAFEHHSELPAVDLTGGLRATVMVGEAHGLRSPARTDTPIVGLALSATAGATAPVAAPVRLEGSFEHGVVVLAGHLSVGGESVVPGELHYLAPGHDEVTVTAHAGTEALLLGGTPFPHRPFMWWNFVARDRAEVEQARTDWEHAADRFGTVASTLGRIAAPDLWWR